MDEVPGRWRNKHGKGIDRMTTDAVKDVLLSRRRRLTYTEPVVPGSFPFVSSDSESAESWEEDSDNETRMTADEAMHLRRQNRLSLRSEVATLSTRRRYAWSPATTARKTLEEVIEEEDEEDGEDGGIRST